jgi:leucine dehydrogenase
MEALTQHEVNAQPGLFDYISQAEHEQVVFCNDPETGLQAIIGLHNTTLGPGLGGCRMYHYASHHNALIDALRLSRGMTYKAAITGLNLGGGKSVIIGDPKKHKSEALFRRFGRYIESLNGRYITAEDVGTTTRDMSYINMETRHVTGLPEAYGGNGDPSPVTGYGVYLAIKAAANQAYGSDSLANKRVLVEGAGKVGTYLLDYLAKEGAHLLVTDLNDRNRDYATRHYGAEPVPLQDLPDTPVHIYAPCALGATLNDDTIPRLQADIIAGAANNQLADEERHMAMLEDRNILYTPDYMINSGGLTSVYSEWKGFDRSSAYQLTENIYHTTRHILNRASDEQISTKHAADRMAEERIEQIGAIHKRG